MRITSTMMQNTMILDVNKNAVKTDNLYIQMITGKQIQVPSDNPIIASRALRYRTNVERTTQYQKNVSQAISWTEMTATQYTLVEKALIDIKDKFVQGASDTYSLAERKTIATQVLSQLEAMTAAMNGTYADRYLFSGYRTDSEATFSQTQSDLSYNITQTYSIVDMQNTKSYQKTSTTEPSVMHDVNILKLPYTLIDEPPSTPPAPATIPLSVKDSTGAVIPVTTTSNSTVSPDPYLPDDDGINYIRETGELVLGKNVVAKLEAGDFTINYDKTGFKPGELNPKVYFECTDKITGTKYDMVDQDKMEYEIGVSNRIVVNSLAKNVLTDKMYADMKAFGEAINNMQISSEVLLRTKYSDAPYNLTGDELDAAINEQIQLETAQVNAIGQDRFSDFIGKIQEYVNTISIQQTDLGTRMVRLNLTETRLEENRLTYEALRSENEEVDAVEISSRLRSAEAVFEASLKIGARIMQISIVNYL